MTERLVENHHHQCDGAALQGGDAISAAASSAASTTSSLVTDDEIPRSGKSARSCASSAGIRRSTDALGPWIALGLFVFIFFMLTPPRSARACAPFLPARHADGVPAGAEDVLAAAAPAAWGNGSGGGSGRMAASFSGGGGSSGGGGASRGVGDGASLRRKTSAALVPRSRRRKQRRPAEIVCVLARASSDYREVMRPPGPRLSP